MGGKFKCFKTLYTSIEKGSLLWQMKNLYEYLTWDSYSYMDSGISHFSHSCPNLRNIFIIEFIGWRVLKFQKFLLLYHISLINISAIKDFLFNSTWREINYWCQLYLLIFEYYNLFLSFIRALYEKKIKENE